ncbi:MAG TPA: DNA primase, partial [Roseiflexaceae bacterium]|nr:DNA primase [Roseiflexaceae bacterium]
TLIELFERPDNRAIWRARLDQPPGTDPEAWALSLDETLREQAERALSLRAPQPQAYRYVNDALECARMLQLDLARRWKNRISHETTNAANEDERNSAHERLVQIIEYIDAINVPKRSTNYNDLHSLHAV